MESTNPENLLNGPLDGPYSVNGFSKEQGMLEKYIQMNNICRPLGWEYDGTTRQATSTRPAVLERGKTYAIAPMVSDSSDHLYDSGFVIGPKNKRVKNIDIFPRPEKVIFETPKDIIKQPIRGNQVITEIAQKAMQSSAGFPAMRLIEGMSISPSPTIIEQPSLI